MQMFRKSNIINRVISRGMPNKMVVQKQSDIGFHHFELKFLKMQLMSEGISVGYSFLGNN